MSQLTNVEELQVIMIDNYDSFTYNLVDQFRVLGAEVVVFRNDTPIETIFTPERLDRKKTIIVISPGPGNPDTAGNSIKIIKRYAGEIPILGICLGHQAIVQHFGGKIGSAKAIVHGKADSIKNDRHPVFSELPNPFNAARYHSLAAIEVPEQLQIIAESADEVMAVQHQEFKILGFQFHPESILTTYGGKLLNSSLHWLCESKPH